jgi:PEP-CTERM motif
LELTVKTRLGFFVLTIAALVLPASVSRASTVTDEFQFFDGSTVVASGSFSYDSSLESGLLTFNDLTAFSISGAGNSYTLADVKGTGALNTYNYFGYDTTLMTFVPGLVDGPQGQFELIFGATSSTIQGSLTYTTGGFSFDPLPGQADPSGLGENDGLYAFYDPANCGACQLPSDFPSFTSFSISAVPEPSTWLMMLLGFLILGFTVHRRKLTKTVRYNPAVS